MRGYGRGYRKVGNYALEASRYVFSIATQMLSTDVRWDSSIGKIERLMKELNIRTDIGGAGCSEDGLLNKILYQLFFQTQNVENSTCPIAQ